MLDRVDCLTHRHTGCRSAGDGLFTAASVETLAAHATERLGLDVQAITLARQRRGVDDPMRVWEVLTPHGCFWLVEDGEVAEIFSASAHGISQQAVAPIKIGQAITRFRELHARCTEAPAEAAAGAR